MSIEPAVVLALLVLVCGTATAQMTAARSLSGVIVTDRNEAVAGASIVARYRAGEQTAKSDEQGRFSFKIPSEQVILRVEGKNLEAIERSIGRDDSSENIQINVKYIVPPIHESVVITANDLNPRIDRLNDALYKNTLFIRDDQLVQTLNAGINVGQHEGGGKSLEVRRFGYNLDHGGVNGGLKVVVDPVEAGGRVQSESPV